MRRAFDAAMTEIGLHKRPQLKTAAAKVRRAQREERDQQAVAIAIRLFLKHGYDNVSMDQIAEAIGRSRRSLFRHFKSKDQLLVRWVQSFNDELCVNILRQPPHLAPLTVFRRALEEMEEFSRNSAQNLWDVYAIMEGSEAARAAITHAYGKWYLATEVAFAGLYADDEVWSGRLRHAAARLGLLGLRIAMQDWTSLPRKKADRHALNAALDNAFVEIAAIANGSVPGELRGAA